MNKIKPEDYVQDEQIKIIQKNALESYKELKKYLDSRGVETFIVAGTAIGAIREKGFIPWDDDIDLGINENQYESFKKSINDSDRFFLSDKKHGQYYAPIKVYDRKKKVIHRGQENHSWTDVFLSIQKRVITKKDKRRFKALEFINETKRKSFKERKYSEGIMVALGFQILKFFLPFPKKRLEYKYAEFFMKLPKDKKDGMLYMEGPEIWYKEELEDIEFEGMIVKIPVDFDKTVVPYYGVVSKAPEFIALNKHSLEYKS